MPMKALAGHLPDDFDFVIADVGSAGGLHRRWKPLRRCVSAMLFEPREDDDIRDMGRDRVYPIGLSDTARTETLYLTALPNMSSSLVPNADLLGRFWKKGRDAQLVGKQEMRVDTLDALAEADRRSIHVLKVDIQGNELSVLKGARSCLEQSVLLAEVEVSFLPHYNGQVLAPEIIEWMKERDFDLIDLYRPKRYRSINSYGIQNTPVDRVQRTGRLAYCDAIFFIGEDRLLARLRSSETKVAGHIAAKAMLALLAYGKSDMAARIFDNAAGYMDTGVRHGFDRYFSGLTGREKLVRTLLRLIGKRVH